LSIEMSHSARRLIFWGAALFLAGLLQGALIPHFMNPKMALSAHLAAVQSGMALMVFGLIWGALVLEQRWLSVTFYSSIASMYLIWFSITLSAVLGASRALPMAGEGFSSSPINEMLIEVIVYIGAGLGIVASLLIVLGLYKGLSQSEA